MKKNELSVWIFSYRKKYYITHPWKLIHEFYWNFRNFWHRGRYGFAYVDVWSWCDWWPKVGAAALRHLAAHNNGYPAYGPWDTPEKWHEYLMELATKLDTAAASTDFGFTDNENEYAEAFHKQFRNKENDNNLNKKYFQRGNEIAEKYDYWRGELFKEIGENLPRFWD